MPQHGSKLLRKIKVQMQLPLGFCFRSKSSGSQILLTCAWYRETLLSPTAPLTCSSWHGGWNWELKQAPERCGTVAAQSAIPCNWCSSFPVLSNWEPVGVPTRFPIAHWLGWHVPVPALSARSWTMHSALGCALLLMVYFLELLQIRMFFSVFIFLLPLLIRI